MRCGWCRARRVVGRLAAYAGLAGLALARPLAGAELPAGPTDAAIERRLASLDTQLANMRQRLQLAGLAVGIVRQQKLWWFKGYGFANRDGGIPVTERTPFHLASLTKTFASTVLLEFVEQGRLDLDAPVTGFGIDLPANVTVRHLFTHTSAGKPGKRYRYDGARFARLDRVVERISGDSFETAVRAAVIEPLALKNTGTMFDVLEEKLASPYKLDERNRLILGRYPTYVGVSAGLVASISDYARYLVAIQQHRFLRASTQAQAFTPFKSISGRDLPYGLGWFVESVADLEVIWHYGWWDSVSTLVLMVPARDLAFIAFANTDGLSRGFGLERGSVRRSPAAAIFLRTLVLDGYGWDTIDQERRNK